MSQAVENLIKAQQFAMAICPKAGGFQAKCSIEDKGNQQI